MPDNTTTAPQRPAARPLSWPRTARAFVHSMGVRSGILTPAEIATAAEQYRPQITPGPRSRTDNPALAIDAVYRAVSVIQTAATQISYHVWRDETQMETPQVIARPDLYKTRTAFFAETVASMALRGEAFWLQYANNAGVVTSLSVLNPDDVQVGKDGTLYLEGKANPNLCHLKLLHLPGEAHGLGPLQQCNRVITGAHDIRDYSAGWLDAPGNPNGILTTDQTINAETATAIKNRFMETTSLRNGPAVLGAGISYKPILIKPADMQLIEQLKVSDVAIARMFGIPQRMMLIDVSTQTYANQEQEDIQFIKYTLMSYISEIEDQLTMILPRGQQVRANIDALLRTDTASRYNAHKTAIDAGFLTVDEVRALEHRPPLTNKEA